jgi:hypothetical protein
MGRLGKGVDPSARANQILGGFLVRTSGQGWAWDQQISENEGLVDAGKAWCRGVGTRSGKSRELRVWSENWLNDEADIYKFHRLLRYA